MKHKVLLVDDEPNVLEGLQRALRNEPYEILTAQSGDEALALLAETDVDVVVSDQEMSGMNGTQLLGRIRRDYPNTIRYILTGRATLDVAISAINEGAISRFFTKPCNNIDLAVMIREALRHKELMAEAWRLLRKVKRQDAILEFLERESPGITHVSRDLDGAILLDEETTGDYERLIEELQDVLGEGAEPE